MKCRCNVGLRLGGGLSGKKRANNHRQTHVRTVALFLALCDVEKSHDVFYHAVALARRSPIAASPTCYCPAHVAQGDPSKLDLTR